MPDVQFRFRGSLELMLGHTYRMQGNLAAAAQAYATAAEIATQANNRYTLLSALTSQATLAEICGRLRQAETFWQKGFPLTYGRRGQRLPINSFPKIGLGRLYREWNRLDEAATCLEEAIQLARQAGLGPTVLNGAIALAQTRQAGGDFAGARTALQLAEEMMQRAQIALLDVRLSAAMTLHWLAEGRAAEAEALLATLLESATRVERTGQAIEIMSLLALARHAQDRVDEAATKLRHALTLAEPEGYTRLFTDEGRPMGELLAQVALRDKAVAPYVTRLLTTFDGPPPVAPEPIEAATETAVSLHLAQWLAEPLSERETEVLRLLAKGYGLADRGNNRPVDGTRTLFRTGSVGKLITWTAVMQLAEQGRLDLHADVNDYLDFTIPATFPEPITLAHLMTHTAGFADQGEALFVLSEEKMMPLRQYLTELQPARVFPPGQAQAYSNYGTALAGYIVERASGESFADYVETHIFAPLEMRHSTLRQPVPPESGRGDERLGGRHEPLYDRPFAKRPLRRCCHPPTRNSLPDAHSPLRPRSTPGRNGLWLYETAVQRVRRAFPSRLRLSV
ncbi:MAG: serine hydrolase [Chloroflexota bacterium]